MTSERGRRSRFRIALFAALFFLGLGTVRAQNVIRFDPSRDLEGFDACFASEFREIYPLETYSDMLAKEMSAAALADVRKRWKADLADAEAKLAALRADPAEESLWLLRHRLAKSAFFSKIAWTEERSVPGFAILVQRPAPEPAGYAANVARRYGPWLEKLAQVFETEYAKPLSLERQRSHSVWAVAILAGAKDYQSFWRVHPNFVANAASACYDLRLGLAVGFEDPFKPNADFEQRYPILNAVVRGMIDGYSSSPEGRPGSLWIEEGLASYLAWHEGSAPACLDERHIRFTTLRTVVDLAQDKTKGPVLLQPIEDLVALKSSEDVDKSVSRLAKALAKKPPSEDDVLKAFYGESMLWMHFLHEGMDGALREPLLKYLRWAFSGEAGTSVLRLAFEGRDLAEIDRAYLRWLAEEARLVMPASSVQDGTITKLFDSRIGLAPERSAEDEGKSPR